MQYLIFVLPCLEKKVNFMRVFVFPGQGSQKVGMGLESTRKYDEFFETRQDGSRTGSSGKKTNGNPVIKGKPKKGNYYVKGDEIVHSLYGRIFIKHRKS